MTNRWSPTSWVGLQFVWGLGLVLSLLLPSLISLAFCAVAVFAYWRSASRRQVLVIAACVAAIDVLTLLA
jgi:hypothetical protein